ncbi:hypothetical protein HOC80_01975 [archaeon]|jgi:hypothetical protein|nr:hypothetical protein [archaeon]MBT4416850.1 hypothetical protein [archaeon]
MSALNDIFYRLEQAWTKYNHLSPREICLRTPAIDRDSEIVGVRKDLAQTQVDAEILLRAITDYTLGEYLGATGNIPTTSQYLQEVGFYCDKPGHKGSPIVATGVFPQTRLDRLVLSPRNLTHIHHNKQHGQSELRRIYRRNRIFCPSCKSPTTRVKTAEVISVYDAEKEEELQRSIKSLRSVDRRRVQELMHPDLRFQTYINVAGGITPISTLLNQDPKKRVRAYPQVKQLVREFGAPLITAKSRMKFRRLVKKYLLTQNIETDRRFLDILGIRFITESSSQCYELFYRTFQNLPFLNIGEFHNALEDYIAEPKEDTGYQTLQGLFSISPLIPLDESNLPEGELNRFLSWICLEAQTRTFEMEIAANKDGYHDKGTRKKLKQRGLEPKLVFMEKVADPRKIAPHKIHH